MKKLLVLVLSITMIFNCIHSVAYATGNYFSDRNELNIVAIGGSITEAGGGADSWGKKISDWIGTYTGKTVHFYNAGVGGTGSNFGLYRLDQDVISKNPDIVFVEFSVNDDMWDLTEAPDGGANTVITFNEQTNKFDLPVDANGNQYYIFNGVRYTMIASNVKSANIKKNMEGIVRQLLALPKRPVIIFNYVGKGRYYVDDARLGRLIIGRPCEVLHEEIAQKYGIPSIDIASHVQKLLNAGTPQADIFSATDPIHPSLYGRTIYADYMKSVMEANPDTFFNTSDVNLATETPEYSNYIQPHIMPYTAATYTGNWSVAKVGGQYVYSTSEQGATATFNYSGKTIGLYMKKSALGGPFEYNITNYYSDGSSRNITGQTSYSDTVTKPLIYNLNEDVNTGDHTITITNTGTGTFSFMGLSVDQTKGDYPTDEEFSQNITTEFEPFTDSFNYSDTTFVDNGWQINQIATYELTGDAVKIKNGAPNVESLDNYKNGIYKTFDQADFTVINVKFKLKRTQAPNVWFRTYADFYGVPSEYETFGITYAGNAAGVYSRGVDGVGAYRFKNMDGYQLSNLAYHDIMIQYNFLTNKERLFIDGVESVYYYNGQANPSGSPINPSATALESFKIAPDINNREEIIIDDFSVTEERVDLQQDILALPSIEQLKLSDKSKVSALIARRNNLVNSGMIESKIPSNDPLIAASARIQELEQIASSVNLKISDISSKVINQSQMFTFNNADGFEISSVLVNNQPISSYEVNNDKLLIDKSNFTSTGNYTIAIESNTGISASVDVLIGTNSNIEYCTGSTNVVPNTSVTFSETDTLTHSATGTRKSKIIRNDVYSALADKSTAWWKWTVNNKGNYALDYWVTSNLVERPLKAEIKDKNGTYTYRGIVNNSTTGKYFSIGSGKVFEFEGTGDEYIKIMVDETATSTLHMLVDSVLLKPVINPDDVYKAFYDENVTVSNYARIGNSVSFTLKNNLISPMSNLSAICALYDGESFVGTMYNDAISVTSKGEQTVSFDVSGKPSFTNVKIYVWGSLLKMNPYSKGLN